MFGQRKNKRFTYNSRFLGNQEIEQKVSSKSDLTSEWQSSRRTGASSKKISSLVVLIALLAAIVAVMYYLDAKLR